MLIVIDYDYMSGQRDNSNFPHSGHTTGFRNGISHPALSNVDDDGSFGQRERYRDFAVAFERVSRTGIHESNWIRVLSISLNWDEEEVETYAFRYFVSLNNHIIQQDEHVPINPQRQNYDHNTQQPAEVDGSVGLNQSSPIENVNDDRENAIVQQNLGDSWTDDDVDKFQSLLAEFNPPSSAPFHVDGWVWAEQIAMRLPGKSVTDVMIRWREIVSSPQMGSSNVN